MTLLIYSLQADYKDIPVGGQILAPPNGPNRISGAAYENLYVFIRPTPQTMDNVQHILISQSLSQTYRKSSHSVIIRHLKTALSLRTQAFIKDSGLIQFGSRPHTAFIPTAVSLVVSYNEDLHTGLQILSFQCMLHARHNVRTSLLSSIGSVLP
jgi:hypothetical protein